MQGRSSLLKGFEAYQVIFDSLTAMIWYKDTRNNFIKVNPAGAKAMGLEPFEIEGKSAYELFPEEAEKYYQDDLEVIRSKRPKLGIVEKMPIASGEKIWVKTDKIPLLNEQGEVVSLILFVIDINQAKKAEAKLQESEETYRIVLESSNDGVALVKEGRHIYVNQKFLTMFGYQDPEEVLGKDQSLTVHPGDLEKVRELAMRREKGESSDSQYEFKGTRKDGSSFDVEISAARIVIGNQPHVLANFRDVTGRKEAERKLIESKEIWERTFDAIPDLISILDTNFRIIQVNKAMADRFGLSSEEFRGKTCYKLVHGTDKPPAYCPHLQSMKDRKEHSSESFEEQLQGFFHVTTSPFFDLQGEMLGSMHVARDITERATMEETLRLSEARYRSYIDVTNQLGWTTNPAGEVEEDIPSWRAYTGQTPEEVKGWGWAQAVHEGDLEKVRKIWMASVRSKTQYEVEYRVRRYDGNFRYFLARGVPVLDEKGAVKEWVGISIDITERRQSEEEREKLLRDLQEAALKIKTLGGLLPICAGCQKIRNDQGYWEQIESFIRQHSEAEFSHGLCPDCAERLYPEIYEKLGKER